MHKHVYVEAYLVNERRRYERSDDNVAVVTSRDRCGWYRYTVVRLQPSYLLLYASILDDSIRYARLV